MSDYLWRPEEWRRDRNEWRDRALAAESQLDKARGLLAECKRLAKEGSRLDIIRAADAVLAAHPAPAEPECNCGGYGTRGFLGHRSTCPLAARPAPAEDGLLQLLREAWAYVGPDTPPGLEDRVMRALAPEPLPDSMMYTDPESSMVRVRADPRSAPVNWPAPTFVPSVKQSANGTTHAPACDCLGDTFFKGHTIDCKLVKHVQDEAAKRAKALDCVHPLRMGAPEGWICIYCRHVVNFEDK